jgi:hypothetical protein
LVKDINSAHLYHLNEVLSHEFQNDIVRPQLGFLIYKIILYLYILALSLFPFVIYIYFINMSDSELKVVDAEMPQTIASGQSANPLHSTLDGLNNWTQRLNPITQKLSNSILQARQVTQQIQLCIHHFIY